MIIKKILALACLGWMGSLSCAGAADKSYCLLVDYSAVPALVNSRKITLNVNVGTCASVAVTVDGAPVTASYNSATGMASFTTTGSSVIVTAVNWTAGGTGAAAKATLYNNLRWAFSLTLDDGIQSQYVNAKPLLDAKGWRAGEAVVASWTNGGGANNYMSWTTVKALRAANWEIYNHTFTHPNPVNCGNFVTEFDQDQTAFTTQLPGYHVNHIVYPYEVSTASTCAGFPPSYLISGEVAGGLNFVDNPLPNVYLAGRNGLYGTDPTSLETMASGASANARPAWMIVITHSVSAGSGAPTDAYATNATALGNLLNYLDSNFGTGGSKNMWFAPSGEVMDYLFTRDKAVVSTCAVPATATPTRTNSPTATATSTLTRTVTSTPTRTSTFTPTLTRTSTATPTRTLTPTPTATSGGAWNSVFLQPNGTGGWTEPTVNLGGRNFKLDDYSYSGYKLSQAGLGDSIPCNNVTITATGDITAPLRTALTTLAGLGGGTLYIPGGTFTLSGTVTITAGNIRIMGTGSGATTILISSAYNPGDKLTEAPFTFMGGGGIGYNQWAEPARGPVTTSCGDVARGSLTVTVGSSAGFAVGNWVVVQQYFWPNFVSVNSANNWTTSPPGTGTDGAFNFTLCYPRKITAIAGNVITLDAPIPFGLKNSDATVWFYKPNAGQFIENDGIEGLTLQVQNNSNDGGRPAGTALAFKGIFNGWARDIKINNVAKNGFKPTWSTRITFLDCVVTGAQDTGGGGWGYGYYTYASSAVLFKRCSATNLRHNFTTENAMTNMVVYSRCNSVKTMGNSASVTMECDDTHYAYSQRILWDMMSQTNNGLLAENRDSQSTDAYETFGGGVVWNYSNTAGNPFGNWQANSVQCSPATITSDSDAQVIGTTGGATIFDNSQDLSAVYINGTVMTGAAPQVGPRGNVAYEGLNRAGLSPSSLFDAQLQTRLGSLPPDVAPASCGPTNTPTRTATATNSPSRTPTATPTSTTTSTSTATLTWTRTSTLTATLTVTNTSTSTPTNTRTNTVTNSATNTMSATPTLTSTFTRTSTNSSTPTLANTSTNSPTSSPTNTFTRTFTASFTATSTNTRSNTPTATSTATPTMTGTPPPTQTPTNTLSSTPTSTSSNTPTVTLTNTSTRTSTNTATSTSTPTFSNTMSPTPTSSRTPTASATFTHTSTNSLTSTFTPTVTFTPTNSFTGTTPPTNTPTYTATNSSTSTPTNTPTNTRTNTSTNSMTPSFTPTPTVTRTFTATPTSTLTSTNSPVFTLTPTATSVTVALSNGSFAPGNSTQLPGTSNVPVLQFQLNNPGISTVTLTNLTLTAGGGGNDGTGISGVSLYVDNNNNGILDGGDSLLQTTTYSGNNGTATFNFSTGIPAGNNRSYLVVDNFSGTANNTFQTGIANMTDLTGTNGTGAVNFTGAPLNGAVITLANATATPTNSPTRTATPVNTNTATNTATFTPTRTHTPTSTNTPTSTSTATISPTSSLTATFTPVFTATSGPHGKPTPILYPNPAPGPMVNILPPPYAGFSDVNVRLFTVAFRKVKEENFSNIPSGQAVPLELTDRWGSPLASGIYYAVVNTNAGRSVGKLLIQR